MDALSTIFIDERVFRDILDEMEMDPWVEHLIRTRSHGYYHSDKITAYGVSTYYLGSSSSWTIWTIRRERARFSTKCLVLLFSSSVRAAKSCGRLAWLARDLELFREESHSPLYLALVFSVNALTWRQQKLAKSLSIIRDVELKTGHGSWVTAATMA